MSTIRAKIHEEGQRLVRFLIIGGVSFVLYEGLYLYFSRWLWVGGNRTLESLCANVLASIFNFYMHRCWTFKVSGNHWKHAKRFTFVFLSATALHTFLFWLGHAVWQFDDRLVSVIVTALIPFYTYLAHKFFTFRTMIDNQM